MSDINNIEKEDENFLFGKNKEVPFVVPSHYFISLEQRIINKIEAKEEMSEFSILSGIAKQKEFILPENYFAKTENKIEYEAELEGLNILNNIPKAALKPLTAEYLKALEESIVSKIEMQDELLVYKTLYSMEKQQNFEVNADYFDSVADRIKERVHSKSQAHISVLEQVLAFILKPKFAGAFGIALLLGVSSVLYFNNKNKPLVDSDCKTLACLEKREMLNEHTIREMDDDNLYDMVDVDKLDKQITKSGSVDSTTVDTIKNKIEPDNK